MRTKRIKLIVHRNPDILERKVNEFIEGTYVDQIRQFDGIVISIAEGHWYAIIYYWEAL